MMLDEDKVYLTAHHTSERDDSVLPIDKSSLFEDADENTPMLLFAGRISKEKGIFELPTIMEKVRQNIPDIKLVIAGTGPAEADLKKALPEAHFTGWLNKQQIAQLYQSLDLFVFPSRFDTFGNVILEAFVYGMPAIGYDCKGPKDIIQHGTNGYLVDDIDGMGSCITQHFADETDRQQMSDNAMTRAQDYRAETIMNQFIADMGLIEAATEHQQHEQQVDEQPVAEIEPAEVNFEQRSVA